MLIDNRIIRPPDKGVLFLFIKDLWDEYFSSNKKSFFNRNKLIRIDKKNVKNITYVSSIYFSSL
tara:strand:+ start:209 stop:400 length:192 start_codon:yes stop_codon:yes gene_type:complete